VRYFDKIDFVRVSICHLSLPLVGLNSTQLPCRIGSPGLDFSDLPLDRAAPCPKRVPPWIRPRSDLFGPLE
jgi:hypothetical protein